MKSFLRFLTILIGSTLFINTCSAQKANVWSVATVPSAKTDQCDCNSELNFRFYKKLVNFLFHKSKPIAEDFDNKQLISIHLQVTPAELKRLHSAENVREIDAIIFNIIESSRDGLVVETKEMILSSITLLLSYFYFILNSELLSMLLAMVLCFSILTILYKYLRWKVIPLCIASAFFITFYVLYINCNRRREMEKMVNLQIMKESNPCEKTKYWHFFETIDPKKCVEYQLALGPDAVMFCTPTEVIVDMFFNEILFNLLHKLRQYVSDSMHQDGVVKGLLGGVVALIFVRYCWSDLIWALWRKWNASPRNESSHVQRHNNCICHNAERGDYVQAVQDEKSIKDKPWEDVPKKTEQTPPDAIEDVCDEIDTSDKKND